jgi:hypothetical protein
MVRFGVRVGHLEVLHHLSVRQRRLRARPSENRCPLFGAML